MANTVKRFVDNSVSLEPFLNAEKPSHSAALLGVSVSDLPVITNHS